MNVAITLRWFFQVDKGRKFPKMRLPGGATIPLISCALCHKRPPERVQFMMIGDSEGYCHECLKANMAEVERTNADAKIKVET